MKLINTVQFYVGVKLCLSLCWNNSKWGHGDVFRRKIQ